MPVTAYMALAFVFGFIQINWIDYDGQYIDRHVIEGTQHSNETSLALHIILWYTSDRCIAGLPVDVHIAVAGQSECQLLVDDGLAAGPVRPSITQHQDTASDRSLRRRVLEVQRHHATPLSLCNSCHGADNV